ncbi:Os05g0167300 [Oryza sativa Japonica Group]|uniref:Os05g0167300 protein n=3 Tax=Oryza TaxID=4527 RepID=A0A0N7KK77_ORYSJ|nr:hypothetical protein DAI22_05g050200 [Oryza sativa Japonica Group]BAS92449.1 Os05g0167300 [Oryza sativa Japonica Group]
MVRCAQNIDTDNNNTMDGSPGGNPVNVQHREGDGVQSNSGSTAPGDTNNMRRSRSFDEYMRDRPARVDDDGCRALRTNGLPGGAAAADRLVSATPFLPKQNQCCSGSVDHHLCSFSKSSPSTKL